MTQALRTIAVIAALLASLAGCEYMLPPVPPGPGPQPGPNPPAPVVDAVSVVVLERSEARTPAIARVLADLPYWQSLAAKGIGWRILDDESPAAAKYLPAAGNTRPVLIVFDQSGHSSAVPLPATTADVSRIVGVQ